MITAWMIKYNFHNDAQISLFQNIVSVLIWQNGILETKQKKEPYFLKVSTLYTTAKSAQKVSTLDLWFVKQGLRN